MEDSKLKPLVLYKTKPSKHIVENTRRRESWKCDSVIMECLKAVDSKGILANLLYVPDSRFHMTLFKNELIRGTYLKVHTV